MCHSVMPIFPELTVYIYVTHVQNNQKDLETVTEQLSEYLERDITSDTLCDIKQKVQDKSRSVLYCCVRHLMSCRPLSRLADNLTAGLAQIAA